MYKTGKTQRGITLIALVITIIVMLILVGVTISMAVKGGLFDYAGKATGETKNELDKEQQLANGGIEVNNVIYDTIDDYLNNKPSNIITFEIFLDAGVDDDWHFVYEPLEFKAEKGMSLEEWVADTRYNTEGFYIIGTQMLSPDDGVVFKFPINTYEEPVLSDPIVDGIQLWSNPLNGPD